MSWRNIAHRVTAPSAATLHMVGGNRTDPSWNELRDATSALQLRYDGGVEPLRLRIAELVIADDAATTGAAVYDAVTDLATAAGHDVVAHVTVANDEAAIRAQLATWIADSVIDVAIATSAGDTSKACSALASLGTARDLSAAAKAAGVQLVTCGTALLFVVPGSPSAIADAMDSIVVPTLAARDKATENSAIATDAMVVSVEPIDVPPHAQASAMTSGAAGMIQDADSPPSRPRRARTQPPPAPRSTTPPPVPVAVTDVPTAQVAGEDIIGTSQIMAIAEAPPPRRTVPPPLPPSAASPARDTDVIIPIRRSRAGRRRGWIAVMLLAGAGAIGFTTQRLMVSQRDATHGAREASASTDAASRTAAATVEPDAAIPEIVIDVATPPVVATAAPRAADVRAAAHAQVAPSTASNLPHAPSNSNTTAASHALRPVSASGTSNAPVGDGCPEATCIADDYAQPCCAQYKTGGDATPHPLARWMVKSAVEQLKPRVMSCGERFAAKGTVKLAVKVAPDGRVTGADVVESPTAELGECVAAAMRSGKFAKTTSGGSFRYPFVF